MRIAVVGSGVSGMVAAYRLSGAHEITMFEAGRQVGGHTCTVDVEMAGRPYAVDMGFIVFNHRTYPRFTSLINGLGVASQTSNMSFSVRCERTGLEYNGTSFNSLFAQRRNALRPSFIRMLAEIVRFNRDSRAVLAVPADSMTLGEYLTRERYSRAFIERYIVPMGMSVWSATEPAMLGFPAHFFIDFFERHGFLSVNDRPRWRAITGGSREYARKITAPYAQGIRVATPVAGIDRTESEVLVRTRRGDVESFDHVILACHADQALALLEQPTAQEVEILRAFTYQENDAALHTDPRMLPRARLARAAWNYHALDRDQDRVAITYDMNILQTLESPQPLLVTLNRNADLDPKRILRTETFHHPVYTPAAVVAQSRRREISGHNRTSFCGAYWRYGFHEDGVVSGEWAAEEIRHDAALEAERAQSVRPQRRPLRAV
jgi:predicted NAD/FAD-binding protein